VKRRLLAVDETTRTTVLPLRLETTLASFKASVEAYEVAAFDGWRSEARFFPNATAPKAVWEAVAKLDCLELDWNPFKSRLARDGESEAACRCGAHVLSAFLIHGRFSLLVLGRHSLIAPPPELLPIRTSTVRTLARILPALDRGQSADAPPADPRGGRGGAGGASPAELGIPLWWARGDN